MTRRKTRKSNGEGSIRQRPDGRWELRATLEDALGRKRRISLYGDTRKEVTAKRDALKVEEAAGTLASPNRHTVETFLKTWLEQVKTTIKPTTHASYEWMTDKHIIPKIGHIPLSKLNPMHVEGLMRALMDDGLSARTATYARAILRRSLQHALRWGLVGRNVAQNVDPPKRTRREMGVWTPEQARTFLNAAQNDPLYGMFYLALVTGMRRGELLGLRWQDLDPQHGLLRIRQNVVVVSGKYAFIEPKTDRSRRDLHVAPETFNVLAARQSEQAQQREKAGEKWQEHDLVFTTSIGTPVTTHTIRNTWLALIEKAGLPRIRFHDQRHTYASVALVRDVSAQVVSERLGHANVAFTLQTYAHVFDEERRGAALGSAELFADPAKPEPEPPKKSRKPKTAIGVKAG